MRKLKVNFTLVAVISLLIVAGWLLSCSNTEKVSIHTYDVEGRVTDLAGKALPNVTIELGTSTALTDANGNYSISHTQASNLNPPFIKAAAEGYETTLRNPGRDPGGYTINFALNPVIDKAAISADAVASSSLLGDVNGDKAVTILDALLAAKCAVNAPVIPCRLETADVNGNGKIEIIDALMISRFATGAITSFPRNK